MKRSLILIVLMALPALAGEETPVQDSPLVAAAKRAKATKKTAVVITNETLKESGAGARITTTKQQAALPKTQSAAQAEPPKAAASALPKAKPKRQARQHDDAERLEDDPGRGDLVSCPSCLPILEPDSPTLPLQEAELSKNPPKITKPELPSTAKPEMPQTVPPRTPEAPPRY
jgi:hypothetical protein